MLGENKVFSSVGADFLSARVCVCQHACVHVSHPKLPQCSPIIRRTMSVDQRVTGTTTGPSNLRVG